ncbi:MAG: HAD family hydrolase [Clostridia bacterium]|nr:HAD family hydrolase [Clostridia bacterium]
MKPDTILFDLDGTLLPMDQDTFVRAYFGLLARKMAPLGYEPKKMLDAVYAGTGAMIKNDGSAANETVFWRVFCGVFGEQARRDEPHFDAFYRHEFQQVKDACGFDARAAKLIENLKAKGYRLVLATNPLFPAVATQSRIRWAGMQVEDFEWVTTYENACFCKPNLKYYEEIIHKLGLDPAHCLMVGNDVGEDMIAGKLGMKTFLLTDCLINRVGEDIEKYPHGSFDALETYIEELERDE